MSRSVQHSVPCALGLIALFVSVQRAPAQCVGWTFDRVVRAPGASLFDARGERVVHVAYDQTSLDVQSVTFERYVPAEGRHVVDLRRDVALPHQSWTVGVAFDGDIAATHLHPLVPSATNACVVHDEWGGAQRATIVPLSTHEYRGVGGRPVDASGDTVALLALGQGSRMLIEFVERDGMGVWTRRQPAQSGTIRTLSLLNWEWVDIDGDTVAYGGPATIPYGAVGVAERRAHGDWQETAILAPSLPGALAQERGLAVSGERIALLHRDLAQPGSYRIWIFARQSDGGWVEAQRIDLVFLAASQHEMSIALDGRWLAVGDHTEARLYELDTSGRFVFVRQILGLGAPFALDSAFVTGWNRGRFVRTVPVDLGRTGTAQACATVGEVVCGAGPGIADLRLHLDFETPTSSRVAAEVLRGPPHGAAIVLIGPDAASWPFGSGTLCIEVLTLAHYTAPFTLDASGTGTTTLPVDFWPSVSGIGPRRYAQALTFGAGRTLSHALVY
jgi:hypothetical protein